MAPSLALDGLPSSAFTLKFTAEQHEFILRTWRTVNVGSQHFSHSEIFVYVARKFNDRYNNQVPPILFRYWISSLQAPVGSAQYQPLIEARKRPLAPAQPGDAGHSWTDSMDYDLKRLMEDPIINQYQPGKIAIVLATFAQMYPWTDVTLGAMKTRWYSKLKPQDKPSLNASASTGPTPIPHPTSQHLQQFKPTYRNPDAATKNSPLPPSVEKAYHLKCIELKRRLMEVEENNDTARLKVHRLERGISKMRVERAILLDHLRKKQQEIADPGSDGEDDQPPSPHSREPSAKRKRSSAPGDRAPSGPTPPTSFHNVFPLTSGAGPSQHHPSYHQTHSYPSTVHTYIPPTEARHLSTSFPPGAPRTTYPLINSLPNGTSVMLIAPGVPKPAPWTIQELDPRHHWSATFEAMAVSEQETEIFGREYLPFDTEGKPILLEYDEAKNKYIHVFSGQTDWKDPIVDAVRRDAKDYREPRTPTGKLIKGGVTRLPAAGPGAGTASAAQGQAEETVSAPPPPPIRPRQSQSQSRTVPDARAGKGIAEFKNRDEIKHEKGSEDEDATAGAGAGSVKTPARVTGGFTAANR